MVLFILKKRKLWRKLVGYKKYEETLFTMAYSDMKRGNDIKLKEGIFRFSIRNYLLSRCRDTVIGCLEKLYECLNPFKCSKSDWTRL